MKLHYYPATDSLYIELKNAPGAEAREIVAGLVVDLDANGNVVGLDIDHASRKLDQRSDINAGGVGRAKRSVPTRRSLRRQQSFLTRARVVRESERSAFIDSTGRSRLSCPGRSAA